MNNYIANFKKLYNKRIKMSKNTDKKDVVGIGNAIVDIITDGTVDAVINTVTGAHEVLQDGFQIRRAAVGRRIPCFTSLDTARVAVETLATGGTRFNVKTVQEYMTKTGE